MRRVAIVFSTVVAILALYAVPAAMACGHGPTAILCKCQVEMLGLDEAQTKKLDALREKIMKRVKPLLEAKKKRRAEMLKLWQAKVPRRKAIVAKHAHLDKVHRKLRLAHIDANLGLLKILNDEQKQKLREQWAAQHDAKAEGKECCEAAKKHHPKDCDCPGCKDKKPAEPKTEPPAKAE
jgi:hypothetical protein